MVCLRKEEEVGMKMGIILKFLSGKELKWAELRRLLPLSHNLHVSFLDT
jgi:hypothetical protein